MKKLFLIGLFEIVVAISLVVLFIFTLVKLS